MQIDRNIRFFRKKSVLPKSEFLLLSRLLKLKNMYDKIWNKDFIMLVLSNFLMHITYYAIMSVLPIYLVSELHASETGVGYVVSAYTIASILIRPFSGIALDKFNRRIVFIIALVCYSLFFSGYLIAGSIVALISLRFIQGLTWGFTTISASTLAVDLIPANKRGEGIGYVGLSTTLGMSFGPVIGLFICHHAGYNLMFISGIIISLSALLSAYLIHLPAQISVRKPVRFQFDNLFDKKSLRPSLNVMIILTTYGGIVSFIALYGREIGVKNTSLFFLLFSIGIATSRITAGKAFDRNGPRKIIIICLILLILGYPVLALLKNAVGYYASAPIIGFGIGVVFPTFQSMVNTLADNEHRGAANSTLYTCLDIGMGFGMFTSGFVAENLGISYIYLISSAFCIVGLFYFLFVVYPYYRKHVKQE